jgi:prepilin-type N-terminal cleavage/methylation domain-containing protein
MRNVWSRSRAGFSLIELSVVLVVVGMMVALGLSLLPEQTRRSERAMLDISSNLLEKTEGRLISFAQRNSRLPCPDTAVPPTGVENCAGVAVGGVPWVTMGLPAELRDEVGVALRYAVYRNAAVGADLAAAPTIGNAFIPVIAGSPPATLLLTVYTYNPTPTQPLNQNDLDFCLTLRTARAQAAGAGFAHTIDRNAAIRNAAFIVASSGVENADGVGGTFDGLNVGVAFDDPGRKRSATYDDLVHATPFSMVESKLSCGAITTVVNASAVLSIAAAHQVVLAGDTANNALIAVTMNAIGIGTASAASLIAVAGIQVAAADVATGAAGCLIPLPSSCAAAALAAASVVANAAGAAAASAAGLLSIANTLAAVAANLAANLALTDAKNYADLTRNAAVAADLGGQQ